MGNNNMISFLFTVLLFCSLHVHKSYAVSAFKSPFFKSKPNIYPNTPQQPPSNPDTPPSTDDDGVIDNSSQSTPDPNPNSSTVEIAGFSIAKQYFYDLGYMPNSTYPFSDILDTETITAISTYQKKFNLNVTGQVDFPTLHQMLLPRCVVPDVNVNYSLNSETKVSWPQGIRWFPNGARTKHLTYGFLPESEFTPIFQSVFTDSFNRWSEVIAELNLPKLIFTETDYNAADIKIGVYYLDNTAENAVAGTIIRYQDDSHKGNKVVGDIRLDGSKYWVSPGYIGTWSSLYGNIHSETVAMHQIGHILGLSHSSNVESVMHPFITTTNEVKVDVTADDKNNILNVFRDVSSATFYSVGHHFTPFSYFALLLINFSIGFILLLY